MPTTRHGYAPKSAVTKLTPEALKLRYDMTEHMATDQSHNSAINRAAHVAIRWSGDSPGNDGYHIKEASSEFGVTTVDTVDRINLVSNLFKQTDPEGNT